MSDLEVVPTPKEYPILWWTRWFDSTREEGIVVNNCGVPYTCKFTLDRSKYDEAKVIVYHGSRFNPDDISSIEDVKAGKKSWVLETQEAPKAFQIKSKWTHVFTHTWTYSFDSDFVFSYFKPGRDPGSFISNILAKPMHTIEEKNQFRKQGLAPVAWIVSSCTSENGRHYYVKQLLKHINIDIYGHCMKNKEWPLLPSGEPMSEFANVGRYKFYLSIENTNCKDYVSEKIERPYIVGNVPIVDGPKDYSRYTASNHSIIRFDDFATPEQLGLRLHELDQDDEKYLSYLKYKTMPPETPLDQFLTPQLLDAFDLPPTTWGPDERGSRCGVCKLARDMAEGEYFNPNKTIDVDRTCYSGKWAYNTWAIEFYWWIVALVVLGIVIAAIVLHLACGRRSLLRRHATGWSGKLSYWKKPKDDEIGLYTQVPTDQDR
ncbi:Alpha-(1,3)-fucosyltransferase 11 [Podila humilis]|nr:Alpha-(1,3)-fucosyltransferase 11 [Podila humilis]